MRRQIQVALALAAAACAKKEPAAADAGPPYTLTARAQGESRRVEVKTHEGFHLNADYPVAFVPEDGGRVPLKESMETTPCGDETCGLAAVVPNVGGLFQFSVCSKDVCLIEKVLLSAQR